PDIFNEVPEGTFQSNNSTFSADVLQLTVDALTLNVPRQTGLSTGQERLFQVTVESGQTLQVTLTTAGGGSNEIFLRHGSAPTSFLFDAVSTGPLMPNQSAIVPATQPGTYFVLIRGHSEPGPNTPVTVLAELLPLSITDV